MLIIHGYVKMIEKDDWENGCDPDSTQTFFVDQFEISSSDEDGIIKAIKIEFDAEDGGLLLNSCGEAGRVDVQLMEDEDGNKATKRDMDLFKLNQKQLWLATYTMYVQKVVGFQFSKREGFVVEEIEK